MLQDFSAIKTVKIMHFSSITKVHFSVAIT